MIKELIKPRYDFFWEMGGYLYYHKEIPVKIKNIMDGMVNDIFFMMEESIDDNIKICFTH